MSDLGTLILPIAGRSSRFPGTRPKWMLTAPHGPLMLELALKPVPNWRQRRVVIGALKEHLEDLGGEGAIRRALGDHPEIVSFDAVTPGPAATVSEIIRRANIVGPIFIKDCDSWFEASADLFDNVICTVDLRADSKIRNVPGKSFVKVNENSIVTGIYEKLVCSNLISVGGYGIRSAELFTEAYDTLLKNHTQGEPFVSHVVLEMIARNEIFRSIDVQSYSDVGTLEAWTEFRSHAALYMIDLDGVVFRNSGAYLPPLWSEPDVALLENVEIIRSLLRTGAQVVFMTARPEIYREKTEEGLKSLGLYWHAIIFGLNHSRRFLINDFAPSNPYPSAVAVNVPRNSEDLGSWLPK